MNRAHAFVLLTALAGCGGDRDHDSNDLSSPADLAALADMAVAGSDLSGHTDRDSGTTSDGGSTPACSFDEASDGTARLLAVYTLPPTSMKALDPDLTQADLDAALTHGAMTVSAPGLGSGVDYAGPCAFWLVTDRGPNGDRTAGDGKTFPLPAFTPTVTRVHADGTALVLDAVLPVRNDAGNPVTGLSNGAADDKAWLDDAATMPLAYVPDGLDPEDLRRLPNGDFAFVEEYSASVGIVDGTTGKVKVRYTPAGVTPAAHYTVTAILPAVFANRRSNKGFEGLALSADGHTAWAVLQSPMGDDGASKFGNSLVNRVVRIDQFDDPMHATVGGHYIVLHQAAASLLAGTKQKAVYYNSATLLPSGKLLLLERVSNPTVGMPGRLTLVVADFSAATNLVGHPELGEATLDPETPSPAGWQTLNLTPASTTVVFDSDEVPSFLKNPAGGAPTPDKLEGVAVINKTTVVISNDNDFGIANVNDPSRLWILRTKAPLY
jgi:hypothetical protein